MFFGKSFIAVCVLAVCSLLLREGIRKVLISLFGHYGMECKYSKAGPGLDRGILPMWRDAVVSIGALMVNVFLAGLGFAGWMFSQTYALPSAARKIFHVLMFVNLVFLTIESLVVAPSYGRDILYTIKVKKYAAKGVKKFFMDVLDCAAGVLVWGSLPFAIGAAIAAVDCFDLNPVFVQAFWVTLLLALKRVLDAYESINRLKAAECGLVVAQYELANTYYLRKCYTEAVKWFRAAAEQGYADAQFILGCCYAEGDSVKQDAEEAVRWYRAAAEQGYAGAQLNLGCCYAKGDGVKQNAEEAVKWFRAAAEQGYAGAQYNLGCCYENGMGVTIDREEAVVWYRRAAKQGQKKAKEALSRLGYAE